METQNGIRIFEKIIVPEIFFLNITVSGQQAVQEDRLKLHPTMEKSKDFFQDQITLLDNKVNEVMCKLADMFFESSSKIKIDIYNLWKKIYQQSVNSEEHRDACQKIQQQISLMIKSSLHILDDATMVLQVRSSDFHDAPRFQYEPKTQKPVLKYSTPYTKYQEPPQIQKIEIQKPISTRIRFERGIIQQCPICAKQMSNGTTFVKHLRLVHEIKIQSEGFDCPHCDVSCCQCKLLITHLFKKHFVEEQFQDKLRKSYYCPFVQQSFPQSHTSKLSHVIRTTPHYSKALDQVLQYQLEQNSKKDKQIRPRSDKKEEPRVTNEQFTRGVTKIKYDNNSYICPICGADDFDKLKYLAGHIKNGHGVKFRNMLICPHCKDETPSAHSLSYHLMANHGIQQQSSAGYMKQVYYTVGTRKTFDDVKKLGQHILIDENYLTFFTKDCNEVPKGQIKSNDNDEDNYNLIT